MILISDYDRTLTQTDGRILSKDKEAIASFRAAGNHFGIASGRSVTNIAKLLNKAGIQADIIIGNNGAVIADGSAREITCFGIDPSVAERVNQLLKQQSFGYAVCDGRSYAYHGFGKLTFKRSMGLSGLSVDAMVAQKHVMSFVIYFIRSSYRATLIDDLNHNYPLVSFPNGFSIDVMDKQVSKAKAVGIAARYLNDSTIYVIGDGLNDIPMIQAYNGFAVSRGQNEVKASASIVFTNISDCIRYLTQSTLVL